MIAQDKMLHFAVAMLLVLQLQRIVPDYITLITVTCLIFGKEFYDLYIKKTFIDYWDIVVGIIGMSLGFI